MNDVYTTDQPVSGYHFAHSSALVFDSSLSKYYGNLIPKRKLVPIEEDDATFLVSVFYKKKNADVCEPIVRVLQELFGSISSS